jgi:putative peptidoglycan lipid II flippase
MLGENGIYGLAVAYIVSWLVQLLTLAIPLAASGFKFIPKTTSGFFGCPALKRVVKMAPPIMLGSWLSPAGVLAGLYFASYISVTGAVTVFDYANAVYVIIAGTLTYSICNYAFPLLSRLGNDGGSEWSRVVRSGIISSAAIIIPFTIAVYILAGEGVTALYMRGKFGVQDVRETVYTLRCIVIGMPSFAVVEVVNRVFYSKGKVYIPMTAALCGIGVNIAASAMLIQIEPLRVGAVGLGCAAGQTAAAAVLLIFLIRRTDVINKNFIINLFQLAAAALFAGAVMITLYNFIGNDPYTAGLIRNLIIAVCVVSAGGIVYFALMKMMRITFGNRETQDWI